MANFDPANPTYPEGCYQVETPDVKSFEEPNKESDPEMNFNKFMYFDANGQIVSDYTIRQIIRSPESPLENKLKCMTMVGPTGGSPVPAHLPNLIDCFGLLDLVDVFQDLNEGTIIYNDKNISCVIPPDLVSVVDPSPVVNVVGLVYPLTSKKVETVMACYSDGLQIFYTHNEITAISVMVTTSRNSDPALRWANVMLDPSCDPSEVSFALGSCVVNWNARGITRPSFTANFGQIVSVHKPMLMVITEARVSKKTLKKVIKKMEYDCGWYVDECVGIMGGSIVLWDKTKVVDDEFMVADSTTIPMRILGNMKAVGGEAGKAGKAE